MNPTEAEDQDKAVAASRNSEHFPMQPVPETHTFFTCICKPYVHAYIYIYTHTRTHSPPFVQNSTSAGSALRLGPSGKTNHESCKPSKNRKVGLVV